jgi:pimeloyl-ACP methyl ester carboxylesterase
MTAFRVAVVALLVCGGCGRWNGESNRTAASSSPSGAVGGNVDVNAGVDANDSSASPSPSPSTATSMTTSMDAGLAPIPPSPLFYSLPVPGFPDAVVSVPNGATSPRPVIVVIHGSGDRPDWNCDAWRHITSAAGFVLCPRGAHNAEWSTKDDERFTHKGGETLRRHIDLAMQALVEKWPGYVDADHPIVEGFSLGATEISQLAQKDPARWSRVAVLEGGHDVWSVASAKAFAAGGGQKVLFGCGSKWCVPAAKAAAARLEKGGVAAKWVFADVGHTNDRPLQEAVMTELAWFLEGDSRWLP